MPNSWLKGRQEQRQNKHVTLRGNTTHTSGTTKPSQLTPSRRCPLNLIDGLNTEQVNNLFTKTSAKAGRGLVKMLDVIKNVFR